MFDVEEELMKNLNPYTNKRKVFYGIEIPKKFKFEIKLLLLLSIIILLII
jgi:hypothetical protein